MALILSESFVAGIPGGFASFHDQSSGSVGLTATYNGTTESVDFVASSNSWLSWKIDAITPTNNLRVVYTFEFTTATVPYDFSVAFLNNNGSTFNGQCFFQGGSVYSANPSFALVLKAPGIFTIELAIGQLDGIGNPKYGFVKFNNTVLTSFIDPSFQIISTTTYRPLYKLNGTASGMSIRSIDIYDDFTWEQETRLTVLNDTKVRLYSLAPMPDNNSRLLIDNINLLSGGLISSDVIPILDRSNILLNKGVLAGSGRINGFVKINGSPDIPVHRLVKLFDEDTNLLVDAIWSDPITGAYDFNGLNPNSKFTVIAYDYEHAYNAVCVDNRSPVP